MLRRRQPRGHAMPIGICSPNSRFYAALPPGLLQLADVKPGGWAAAPRCTRNARFGVPQGHRRTLMGHIWSRPKLRCMLCRRSNSGLGAFSGVSSGQPLSSTNNYSVGEGLSLPGERFRGIGDCRAAKPKQKTRLELDREGAGSLWKGAEG